MFDVVAKIVFTLATAVVPFALHRSGKKLWRKPVEYPTEKLEKACDAVLTLIAFLVPASIGLYSWMLEQIGQGYGLGLVPVGVVWLVVVALFTSYMRFNFLWRQPDKNFKLSSTHNYLVVTWISVVMYGISLAILFMAVPIAFIALKGVPKKEEKPAIVTVHCPPAPTPAQPPASAPPQTTPTRPAGSQPRME